MLGNSGNLTATIPGEKGPFNGIAVAGKGWYLAADANGSEIVRIDPGEDRISVWFKDDRLAPGPSNPLGANRVKVHVGST